MKSQITEKLKASTKRLATKLQKLSAPLSKPKGNLPAQESKMDLEKPLSMAYQLMGDKTARFMPLFKDLIVFYVTNALIAAGFGIMNTTIPSLISKKAKSNEQGTYLGVTASVASIANIPGPLLGGLLVDLGGITTPFLLSSFLLLISLVIGCKVFKQCKIR